MLKIEDLRIGMKVYIDATGYGVLTVSKLGVAGFFTEKGYLNYKCSWIDWGKTASLNELSVQEQSQYTFDDLIDVAVQAYKDGILSAIDIVSEEITIYGKNFQSSICDDSANEGIEHIQSLYKETFVIEVQEDIERLKNGAKVTLKNGEAIYFSNIDDGDYWFDFDHVDCQKFPFLALKGATVEQERGRDD